MQKRAIYCEIEFLQQMALDQSPQRVLMQQFLGKSMLYIDSISHFRAMAVQNPQSTLFGLLKANNGGGHFIREKAPFPGFDAPSTDGELNAIYLRTHLDKERCQAEAAQYGVMVLNPELFDEYYLNKTLGKAIPDEAQDWTWLRNLNNNYPRLDACNAMVIIDPYILQDRRDSKGQVTCGFDEKINENLDPILDQLLPQSLENGIVFHIDMFVEHERGGWTEDDWDERYHYVCDTIEDIRPNLNYSLIIYDTREFHDRIIITNNVAMRSGAGFDVFPRPHNANPTTVAINFPFVQTMNDPLDKDILQQLNLAKQIATRKNTRKYGDRRRGLNRMIRYYTS